jgi:predicted nucleic acid-binding protein
MKEKVFFDTNIFLDVGTHRIPFLEGSGTVLAMAESNWFWGFTSSTSIATSYYFLRKNDGDTKARAFLSGILGYIEVLPVDHTMTLEALQFDFSDFEDALQYSAALRHRCDCIITRDTGHYKTSKLDVYTPDEFLQLYAG